MKSENHYFRLLTYAYLIMLLVIFILPFYSVPEYSIIKNTPSHLGGQNMPAAWIMNITFILLGVASIWNGWPRLKGYWFQRIVLLIFGGSLILCAFYQHAPIIREMPVDVQEDKMHSIFATLTGFSFSVFAIATCFITNNTTERAITAFVGMIALLLSILMFQVEDYMGIWQRMIFIISFGWMIYIFKAVKLKHV